MPDEKRPRMPPLPREEVESDPPPPVRGSRGGDPPPRQVFVTRAELDRLLSNFRREVTEMIPAEISRTIEMTVSASVTKAFEPIKKTVDSINAYNEARAKVRAEEAESLRMQVMRGELESQNDEKELRKMQMQKLQHPSPKPMPAVQQAPVQVIAIPTPYRGEVIPIELPEAPTSPIALVDPKKNRKLAIVVAVIIALTPVIVAAIAAWSSQHASPHGAPAEPAKKEP